MADVDISFVLPSKVIGDLPAIPTGSSHMLNPANRNYVGFFVLCTAEVNELSALRAVVNWP
jgi:hypothetical protein